MRFHILLTFLLLGFFFSDVFGLTLEDEEDCGSSEDSSSGGYDDRHSHHSKHHHHGSYSGHKPPPSSTTTPAPETKCLPGWARVQRQRGGWCLRVFQGVTNQAKAEAACQVYGAVVSGVESQHEREVIAELGRVLMTTTSNWKYGTVRLGLRRATRTGPFFMTDGNAIGTDGIKWSPGEPNSGQYSGYSNNCGLMWMWVPGGKLIEQRVHGQMFSMVCELTWNDRWRAYVCGMKAT